GVQAAAHCRAARASARRHPPDLIGRDVMVPVLDGFELVRRIRRDDVLGSTAIIMLSARAGGEASIDGLDAGADDYPVKPFSARELTARVEAQLRMRRQRLAAEGARRSAAEATRPTGEVMA